MTVAPWNRDASNAIDASQAGLEAAEARHRPASATRSVRAPWVFAADGARSTVRRLLGVEVEDFGVDERWLNFDTVVKRPLDKSFLRTALTMDPARPYMFMPIGTKRQRFEIRIAEHEREADVQRPEVAWNWLRDKQGLGPDDVEIIRQIVYPFETRVARQWRQGRVLIGGDAAHTMPPYAGEGACSAMRDARNAAWKLDLVLQGWPMPASSTPTSRSGARTTCRSSSSRSCSAG